jgi:hypothetical protein
MKTITVTKYVARDGMEFYNKDDCINYERNFIEMSKDVLLEIPHQETLAGNIYFATTQFVESDHVFAFRIRHDYDLEIMNQFLAFRGFENDELFTHDDIGTIQLFLRFDGDTNMDEVRKLGTPAKLKQDISREIDDLFRKITE